MNRTIPKMFEESVNKFSNNILMWEKKIDKFEGTTYLQMQKLIRQFAAGLISIGVNKGDRVALISEGRNDWVMSELAVLSVGAVNVPISVKIDELTDLKFRISHSGCKVVIISGNHLHKVRKIKNDLPELEHTIILDEVEVKEKDELLRNEVLDYGEKFNQQNPTKLQEVLESINENDYANICYTSGTTADPKGIILTHRNYTANVEQATALLPIPESYCSLLILPWDHSFAHTAGIYTLMKNGASMASIQLGKTPLETLKNVPINIKEIQPTFLLSVPALAKNFRKNIEKGIKEKGEKVEKLFNLALKIAYDYNGNGFDKGKGFKALKKPLHRIFDKIIFSKIREGFGGRLEFFIGGGALLDIELQRFFYAIGIPMFQGYGLSEAAPIISSNVPRKHKLGSSGSVVINLDVKICDDNGNELKCGEKGEIVCRGENVMAGYWKNEKATNETIRDGWLFTGDLGYFDEDGFLYVLGRNKSLLISSDGEKYSPEGIEETITENSKFIDQLMLYNNQSPYTTALLVPNKEFVLKYLNEKNIDISSVVGQDEVIKLFKSELDNYIGNGKFSQLFPERWLPSTFAILGEGFSEQNKLLNSTLKMVRGKITEFYSGRIEFMYSAEGKNIFNNQNRNIVSRF